MRYVLVALVTIAVFRATRADAAAADEPRTMEQPRATELRAIADSALREADLLSDELAAEVSLGSMDLQLNFGALQGAEEIEDASESQIDYDHDGDVDEADLARAAQNPVAAMISLPFQNNFNGGFGDDDEVFYNLNIQPVYPARLTANWSLISRAIIPILDAPLTSTDQPDA